MTRDEIPTPALLLDMDRFERNLERMAKHVRTAGKQLRPHAKTHRCPEIAHRQIAAGALGVACAKLGEAEVMARFGIRGLLITTEVVAPSALRRLTRLVAEAPDTMVVVDNRDNVDALARAAAEDGVTLNVMIDIDVGGRRTGATRRGRARARTPRRPPRRAATARLAGVCGALRARDGMGQAPRGLARRDDAADGDARTPRSRRLAD